MSYTPKYKVLNHRNTEVDISTDDEFIINFDGKFYKDPLKYDLMEYVTEDFPQENWKLVYEHAYYIPVHVNNQNAKPYDTYVLTSGEDREEAWYKADEMMGGELEDIETGEITKIERIIDGFEIDDNFLSSMNVETVRVSTSMCYMGTAEAYELFEYAKGSDSTFNVALPLRYEDEDIPVAGDLNVEIKTHADFNEVFRRNFTAKVTVYNNYIFIDRYKPENQ